MSREMRVFVSLIVWLFFIRGADGELTVKPDNFVIVKGTTATLLCATDEDTTLKWTYENYIKPAEEDDISAINEECKPVVDFVDASQPSPKTCNLIAKDTLASATHLYLCTGGSFIVRGIVIVLESPLKCGIEGNKYSCTMANSAYKNESEITSKPYISSRLLWKDDKGNEVASMNSDFQNPGTVVTTDIPVGNSNPYVCSAEFNLENLVEEQAHQYSKIITIVPDGRLECTITETPEQEEAEQVTEAQAEAAAAKQAGANKTSNANLERDGVDAIAMMLSLMAAFLVY